MRQMFASLPLQDGAPNHLREPAARSQGPSITLRVDAHWLPDDSREKLVNLVDDTNLDASSGASERAPRRGRDRDTCLLENGEPHFRELEPDRDLAAPHRRYPSRGVTLARDTFSRQLLLIGRRVRI